MSGLPSVAMSQGQAQRKGQTKMHSNRVRHMVVALLAVFVFGAVAAAAAQAEEAPFWSIEGTRLRAGETHYIAATRFISEKEKNNFTLSINFVSFNVTIICEAVRFKEGVILGSSAGEPGTNDEFIEFEKCKTEGNGKTCTVEEPVITKKLRSELVEDVHKEKLDVELSPASGAIFMTVRFFGTCKVEQWNLGGSLAGEVLTDPGEEPVSVTESKKQAKSWLIKLPATPIKEVWLVKGGVGKEAKVGLEESIGPVTLTGGAALISLANSKREPVEEEWGPLP